MSVREKGNETGVLEFSPEDNFLVPTYQKFPHKIVRGEGALLFDDAGREFIDLSGGYGVAIVGHANPMVSRAVSEQSKKLVTCHGSLYNDAREKYVSEISKILPRGLDRLYLCNSGTEANEAAIKFARKATGRKEIVAFTGSYHGKTYGALSATWNQKYKKGFEPLLEGFKFAQFGKLDKTRELVNESTAAVIVEPVQGESGIHVPPDDFLPSLRELASSKGCLLIADEVQSGFGRTGRMWACENWDVTPDILTASKGVAGGIPFGFAAMNEKVSSALHAGDHTSTFGGNPIACSAASAALRFLLDSNLLQKASNDGAYFLSQLEGLRSRYPSLIREIRGRGMMIGIELKVPVRDSIMLGFEHNLVLLYSGLNILRLLPPLVITRQQIDLVVKRLGLIFASMKGKAKESTEVLSLS